MLIIRNGEYESLRRHGEETYPFECCGALLGRFRDGNRVERVSGEAVNSSCRQRANPTFPEQFNRRSAVG